MTTTIVSLNWDYRMIVPIEDLSKVLAILAKYPTAGRDWIDGETIFYKNEHRAPEVEILLHDVILESRPEKPAAADTGATE